MHIKSQRAFTLVELMITAFVLLVGISGVLVSYVNFTLSAQASWDTTVATTHAECILEEMQGRQTAADITATDWDKWAQGRRLMVLPQETIRTVYGNPSENPLDIKVIVEWRRNNGPKSLFLDTKLTR